MKNFSRGDFALTRLLLLAVAVLYPLSSLLPAFLAWAMGDPLELPGHTSEAGPALDLPSAPGVSGHYTDDVVWSIADPTAGQRLAAMLPAVFVTAVLAFGCVLLWRVVAAIQRGEPFAAAAVRRLRTLGLLVIGFGVVSPYLDSLTNLMVVWNEGFIPIALSLSVFSVFPVVVGVLVLVLAESFRIGRRLREDVEGLV